MTKGSLRRLELDCLCQPGAVRWIEVWFGDCVYSPWEILGFCVGMSSVFFWMIAQMPQFVSNFLRQSADALSPWFLFQWLAGDSLNLLGCLLTGDQLATETFTAYYFIFADGLIISQYLYYRARNNNFDESVHKPTNDYQSVLQINSEDGTSRPADLPTPGHASNSIGKQKQDSKRQNQQVLQHSNGSQLGILARGERFQDFEEEKLQHLKYQVAKASQQHACPSRRQLRRVVMEYGLEYGPPSMSKFTTQQASRLPKLNLKRTSGNNKNLNPGLKKALCLAGTVMAGIPGGDALQANRKLLRHCSENQTESRLQWVKQTGTFFGWISSGLYLGSRISQLVKNNQRKSAEGLSLAMVSCAVLANLTYGAAILMRAKTMDDLIGKAPWLLGSLGTVSLDITIFLQAQYLSSRCSKKDEEPNETTPLLPA
ncbi:hypothetical protein SELMODRAFT_447534 [Selaginella moellendorffii]|uniref:Uncharacterized protein n=1 Tax=Selaginella moellendorffii TaxID=88036 RepID=D8T093_SELML|nr:uncharacterized protein LOC9629534 [Selaginella moellendorffii]EFJ09806.1 hypothetical protein SELMODRAFT_447534 [Selaginella moellendorffii]|eukprot:XP_002989012.1 uncharacterized protein LOC9629534 [Selaginella moellendorffii]